MIVKLEGRNESQEVEIDPKQFSKHQTSNLLF